MQKLVVEARVNEYAMRAYNPSVPFLPGEIARDAAACRAAGAAILHFHGRDADGGPDHRYETYRDTILATRALSDILIHPTLGYVTLDATAAQRIATVARLAEDPSTRPEFAPMDVSSTNVDWYDPQTRAYRTKGLIYRNGTDTLEHFAGVIRAGRMAPGHGLDRGPRLCLLLPDRGPRSRRPPRHRGRARCASGLPAPSPRRRMDSLPLQWRPAGPDREDHRRRRLNLAHGAVFTGGAFAALYAITLLGMPLLAAILLAVATGGILAILLDLIAFRPVRRRGATEFATIVSSIGAGLVLTSLAQQVSDTRVMRFPFGTFRVKIYQVFGLRIQLLQLVILGTVALLVLGLLLLYRTSLGRQIRAVAISQRTAQFLGINPGLVFAQVFVISGMLAGLAGVLIGLAFNSVHFMMGEPLLLRAFVVVVLGGLGSIPGAVCAGLTLGIVQSLSVAYLSSGVADAILFSILFVMLLVRPTGLFPGVAVASRVVRA